MQLHKLLLLTLSSIILVALTACQNQPTSSSHSDSPTVNSSPATKGRGAGEHVKILYWQAASSINPYLGGGTKETDAASLVIEPLARYNEDGELIPWLVEKIPTLENDGISEDLTTITWKIKEGILWADGTPFTAEDVVFTADYCLDENIGCTALSYFSNVKEVKALDDLTVQVTFNQPKPFPYGPFVSSRVPIIQKAQFADCLGVKAQQCTEQNFAPIGTGPYQIEVFRANDVIRFKINPNYRDANKPFFKQVTIKGGGAAAATARSVLKIGEADYAWNLQVEPQILRDLEAADKGKVIAASATRVEMLFINFTNPDSTLGELRSEWSPDNPNPHPFLTDHAVRRALSLAIDRNVIVNQLYGAGGKITCNTVPAPAIYASSNNDECFTQNIDKANAILDEAGWLPGPDGIREKEGVRLSILYQTSTNSVRQSTQALIKQWWQEIGVETELRNIKGSIFFGDDVTSPDTRGKFYADVEMFYNGFNGSDPEGYLNTWACSNIANSTNQWLGKNFSRWCNETYDKLLTELANTADVKERAKIVIELNDIMIQDYAILPLVYRGKVSAQSNTLEGVRLNAWDSELWNIADWTRKQ